MMMALGMFVFMLQTVPYQDFQHQMAWRHPSNARIGLRPISQFLGPDEESITLSGVLYPELTGGKLSLMALQLMAETGKAWSLIEGNGAIHGMFVIESLERTKSIFFSDGSARKIEFTLSLKRTDESLKEMFGDLSQQFDDIASSVSNTAAGLLS
ncbi:MULTISPECIES: phage tail protein [Yersinia pseudotuberculosis complex]|uniref:Phage P2 GpU n=1 Tax=Yersinia pseudotuberculosis serotype O:1b (strain IP 31758) TaxID=349747 RepID=A0A0U1QY14_YERP3|nr:MULTISPECIES: phage tail protein [Yersinia pseudotuberculosis complex]ABS47574.1 phage P2 GpU [Yersinia pseudotuberculosis IP 31758]MCE4114739.1 phage tail protein [Yersinia pseudotuberculosis]RYC18710.1 phage tail protein [Yersinia pseudotuberculosis]WLF02174.1 phage tail protein [Yersinia pseudotuberculosis]BET62812.1 phage tail protein [Yersinia pseudotuberculosis]